MSPLCRQMLVSRTADISVSSLKAEDINQWHCSHKSAFILENISTRIVISVYTNLVAASNLDRKNVHPRNKGLIKSPP